MRNLKKILALVLALVMSFSLVSVSSAAFKDADSFTDDYVEAVDVLTALKVVKGYEDGSFNPKGNITRAEAAAIIYRIVTGDVKDAMVDIYAGYGKFADVAANNWAAGYIGYCANAEFIKGYDANTFGPKDNVTGYQMLAMLLRALGYGKNGEFTGANWAINTARYAESLGLLSNVTSAHAALSLPATRELVCELVFSAMTKTAMVNYTLLTGYQPITVVDDKNTATKNDDVTYNWTLGYETFGLVGTDDTRDPWGRPGFAWYIDSDRNLRNGFPARLRDLVASFAYEYDVAYNTAEDECCIAADLGVKKYAEISALYVNGNPVDVADYDEYFSNSELTANDTKNMIGEQGRQVEFYYAGSSNGIACYDVVMIDTFFAIVTDVTEVEYDKNNHIAALAELDLMIFNNGEYATSVTLQDDENYEYKQYDCLLVNAWTEDHDDEIIDTDEDETYVEFVGYADVFKGAQSAFTNQPTHIVDDVEYTDAYQLVLDEAGLETTNHLWFKDQFGNIIAIMDDVTEYTYGTISAIKWVDTNDLLSNGYAYATITNMDGEQKDFKVISIDGTKLAGIEGDAEVYGSTVSSTKQYNNTYCNVALYRIEETSSGLKLTTLTKLDENAEIQTGVAEIGMTEGDDSFKVFGGKTTKYLVWTGAKYLTYTGIKNVPSLNDNNTFWAGVVDADEPVAEYIFVNGASQDADYTNITFFAYSDANLKVKSVLNSGIWYYVISGGYVNGELNTITIPAGKETKYQDNELVMFVLDNAGALLNLYTANGSVYSGEVVSVEAAEIESTETYAIYAGEAADAYMDKDVLIANDEDYDVDGAVVISYKNKTLNWHLKNDDGYVFVVYVENSRTFDKNATFVYVTDVAGASKFEVAKAEYEKLAAELGALIAELDTMGITLAEAEAPEADDYDTTVEYKIALVNYYTAALAEALDAMTDLAETEDEAAIVEAATTEATELTADAEVAVAVAIVDYVESAVAAYEALVEKVADGEDATVAELAELKAAMNKATELLATLDAEVVEANEDLKAAADYVTGEFEAVEDYAPTDGNILMNAVMAVELDAITITYVTGEDANVTLINELSYAIAEDASIVALGDLYDLVEIFVEVNPTYCDVVLNYNEAFVGDMVFIVRAVAYETDEDGNPVSAIASGSELHFEVKVTYKKK